MEFGLEFWALTFDVLGKLLLVVMAILVHRRIEKEGKIDKRVLKEMDAERLVGGLAIFLILLGYILHLYVI